MQPGSRPPRTAVFGQTCKLGNDLGWVKGCRELPLLSRLLCRGHHQEAGDLNTGPLLLTQIIADRRQPRLQGARLGCPSLTSLTAQPRDPCLSVTKKRDPADRGRAPPVRTASSTPLATASGITRLITTSRSEPRPPIDETISSGSGNGERQAVRQSRTALISLRKTARPFPIARAINCRVARRVTFSARRSSNASEIRSCCRSLRCDRTASIARASTVLSVEVCAPI